MKKTALFANLIEKEKPDVILTLHTVVREWLEGMGKKNPRDISLIQLNRRRSNSQWSGRVQYNDLVGAEAVEMLIGMIHNNNRGIPAFPRATLIGSTWIDGKTTLDSRFYQKAM